MCFLFFAVALIVLLLRLPACVSIRKCKCAKYQHLCTCIHTHATAAASRQCNISSQLSGLVTYYCKHFRADAHSYLTQTHNTNTCTHIRCREITSNNMHAPKQTHPKIYLISLHRDCIPLALTFTNRKRFRVQAYDCVHL